MIKVPYRVPRASAVPRSQGKVMEMKVKNSGHPVYEAILPAGANFIYLLTSRYARV